MKDKNKKWLVVGGVLIVVLMFGNGEDKKEVPITTGVNMILDHYSQTTCTGGGCNRKVCTDVVNFPDTIEGFDLNFLSTTGQYDGECVSSNQVSAITCPAIDVSLIPSTSLHDNALFIISVPDGESCNDEISDMVDENSGTVVNRQYNGLNLVEVRNIEGVDGSSDVMLFCSQDEKYLFMYGEVTEVNEPSGLCDVGEVPVHLEAQRMFSTGTSLSYEKFKIVDEAGYPVGSGNFGGIVNLKPDETYLITYGYGSSLYYAYTEPYVPPCQQATDDVSVELCFMDTHPTITVFDENGQVQIDGSNAQEVGADETVMMSIKVKASADACYGQEGIKLNTVCFDYPSQNFEYVKVLNAMQTGIDCYAFNSLEDTESQTLTVEIRGGQIEPTSSTPIGVIVDDGALGVPPIVGGIQVS